MQNMLKSPVNTLVQSRSFHVSAASMLRRPWKTYKDGTLFYGQSKAGNKRLTLSTKQGNKNYYKGTRSSGIGHLDKFAKYDIDYQKVRTFVTPADMSTPLKALVSANCPVPKNTFANYTGPTDGRLWLDKVKEYVETGDVKIELSKTFIEKY